MADTLDRDLTPQEIREQIAEAKRQKDAANINREDRRAQEVKTHKERVNDEVLYGGAGRNEPYTFRARPSQIKTIKALAKDLSKPRKKVSVAALMDEAMELLFAKYHRRAK